MCRDMVGYALSANSVFEYARIEREDQGLTQIINVYKSEFKYQEINDHFKETLMGQIVQRLPCFSRTIEILETTPSGMNHRYSMI